MSSVALSTLLKLSNHSELPGNILIHHLYDVFTPWELLQFGAFALHDCSLVQQFLFRLAFAVLSRLQLRSPERVVTLRMADPYTCILKYLW